MVKGFRFNIGDKVKVEGTGLGVGKVVEQLDGPDGEGYAVRWPNPFTPRGDYRADTLSPADAEAVRHPAHYGGDTTYEAIKVIEAWGLGFHLGNTVKYISRAGKKDQMKELEDLEKASWYLQRYINELKES